jgi:hypothetical protein
MNTSNSLGFSTVLCLPAPDVKALGSGRSICAITALFLRPGQKFLLFPTEILDSTDRLEWCYRSEFCQEAKQVIDVLEYDLPEINSWATCECSLIIDNSDQIDALAALSIWRKDWLIAKLNAKKSLFITILRVHKLATSFSLPAEITYYEKIGRFLSLQAPHKQMKSSPVLSDPIFARRKHQLEKFTPPEHPNLETLKGEIAHYSQTSPAAKALENDLEVFLGWADPQPDATIPSDWIKGITISGNSSDGNLFEKRVRQSFIHLGFTNTLNNIKASLDPDATGGAGGIDIYCETPFPLVGECKASKHESVPNSVSAQLIHLGNTHLGKEQFEASIKIIFAAGKLTDHAEKAAVENHMNVMRPDTLQRLVELKTAHPGAINLLELKPCLENAPFSTDADTKVNQFIDGIWQSIKVRSHIVTKLKDSLEISPESQTGIDRFYGYFCGSNPPQPLGERELYNILIELSSPLAGYLGRTKGTTWQDDRFYFLRDLIVESV